MRPVQRSCTNTFAPFVLPLNSTWVSFMLANATNLPSLEILGCVGLYGPGLALFPSTEYPIESTCPVSMSRTYSSDFEIGVRSHMPRKAPWYWYTRNLPSADKSMSQSAAPAPSLPEGFRFTAASVFATRSRTYTYGLEKG